MGSKLPRNSEAVVSERKITDYLLSESHPVGRAKAKYFVELGYGAENAARLKEDLLALATEGVVADVIDTPFGAKYVGDGELLTPAGLRARVRTIWILETGQSIPRFITAYPRGE